MLEAVVNMIETINLFGTEIKLKTHNCNLFDNVGIEVEEPNINFYVRTKHCNASCSFCTFSEDASKWNGKKYKEVLKHITSKIKIRKIGVSGGEPMLNWDNFLEISNLSKEISPDSELSLNTNGYKMDRFFSHPIYKEYDFIQLSRHHYNDIINDKIFKCKLPTSDEIKTYSEIQTHKDQLQFRCNLIKGHIDNKEEIFKFLEWSNLVGVNDIGIVSLMPVNDYSKKNFIYFKINELIGSDFILSKKWDRIGGCCECFNYIYLPENNYRRPIRVYHKNTYKPSEILETIVFDGENVRVGFGGKIIY